VVGDQLEQGEFLRNGLAVLSPTFLFSFEEGELPPVYENAQTNPGGKPKWRLVQGVGPAGLELDRSRTGRLHKPSLNPFGVDTAPLALPAAVARGDALADAVREACSYAEALVQCRGEEEASTALRRWRERAGELSASSRPVLENWEGAKAGMIRDDDIAAYVAAAEKAGAGAGTGSRSEGVESMLERRVSLTYFQPPIYVASSGPSVASGSAYILTCRVLRFYVAAEEL
jgi:hypothetical protein